MGSRVIAKTQDLRLREGYMHTQEAGGLRMVGVPHCMVVGGYVETGAELKGINELVRFLNDALKPKLYAYERYNDMYLCMPT